MVPKRHRKTLAFAALTTVFLFLGRPLPAYSQQNEPITFKATWLFTASSAGIFLGIEEGYFKAEGIDLTFRDGRGSRDNLQLLHAKNLKISLADIGTAVPFITQGSPLKAVYGYAQSSPMSIIAHADLGIRTPKDLEGKKVGRAMGSANTAIFPAVIMHNKVDESKITYVNTTPAAQRTALLNRDVDAILIHFPDNVPLLIASGAKVNYLKYSDFGAETLGAGIVAHTSYLEEKPVVVRGLLRAFSKSIKLSLEYPDKAVDALKRAAPLTVKDAKIARETLDGYLALIRTKNSQGKPLGWMARQDWENTIQILTEYVNLKNAFPGEKYYTNDFIAMDIM